ncbi:MAG: radical SAM protein [Clostridia bacterium]|nr:radical SAM protein [Clostridia bacterium]
MSKHANISLFVPHAGCPHQCTFCNQRAISGETKRLTREDVTDAVLTAIRSGSPPETTEIAFFGGSFTAIDRSYMTELLSAAYPYVESGQVRGIRCSTRPDYIDGEILALLKRFGVTSIELGAQSMDDRVLRLNKRGHTASDVERASFLIRESGFELGLQMMTGLYGDSDETCIGSAERIISLCPATIRIYPTVVIEGTELAELYRCGEYRPQTVDEAVKLCAKLVPMFESAGIRVIRLGLHSGGGVSDGYIAGAYHPAFGELVESEIILNDVSRYIRNNDISGDAVIFVNPSRVSVMTGQKRRNIEKLAEYGVNARIKPDDNLSGREFVIEECI